MALTPTPQGPNPQIPGIAAQLFIPDQLIAGDFGLVTKSITLAAGTLQRGTVIGQKTVGAATTAAKAGGNTGNGTITMDATTPVRPGALAGVYTVRMLTATTFRVEDPQGDVLGDGATGVAFDDDIKFVVAVGGTPFIAGDGFDVTLAAGDGTWLVSVKTASDGSQNPAGILVDYADASVAPVVTGAYLNGEFNQAALTIDASWTLAELEPLLRSRQIFFKSAISALPPT